MTPEIRLVREIVQDWTTEAKVLRRRGENAAIARTLDACAAELQERFARQLEEPLTPAEWAALHGGVSPQSVTTWCRRGELEAYRDAHRRWRIPPHAERRAHP